MIQRLNPFSRIQACVHLEFLFHSMMELQATHDHTSLGEVLIWQQPYINIIVVSASARLYVSVHFQYLILP